MNSISKGIAATGETSSSANSPAFAVAPKTQPGRPPSLLQEQFIELRAQDLTLVRISEQIGVPKRTLVDWNAQFKSRIAALRAVEFEAFRETVAATHRQRFTRLATLNNRLEAALDRRDFFLFPTDKLLAAAAKVRCELDALDAQCRIPDEALPTDQDAPGGNSVPAPVAAGILPVNQAGAQPRGTSCRPPPRGPSAQRAQEA